MFMKDWKKEVLTIPNLLSLFRLVLIPVYVMIYLNAHGPIDYYLAGGILALSCMTDLIDGKIARRFNMVTNLGKLLDPIADKSTQFALTLCISFQQPVLQPVLVLFVIKETFQLIAMLAVLRQGKALDGALMEGKICTAVLFLSLLVMVLFPTMDPVAVRIIAAIDTLFLLISFAGYLFAYFGRSPLIRDIEE